MLVKIHVDLGAFLQILRVPMIRAIARLVQISHDRVALAQRINSLTLSVHLRNCRDLFGGVHTQKWLLAVCKPGHIHHLKLVRNVVKPGECHDGA